MKVSVKKWIWLQLGALALLLASFVPLGVTRGAVWSIVLCAAMVILYFVCLLVGQSKLRCPACGAPLYGMNGRYLLERERACHCSKCGTKLSLE